MVFSYEIYGTRLWRVSSISYEVNASLRFCLSCDSLKLEFIAFKMNIILLRKLVVDMDIVSNVTCMRQSVITHVVI